MKKEYMNPSMLTIEVDATVDTVKVSNTGDGIIIDLGDYIEL